MTHLLGHGRGRKNPARRGLVVPLLSHVAPLRGLVAPLRGLVAALGLGAPLCGLVAPSATMGASWRPTASVLPS